MSSKERENEKLKEEKENEKLKEEKENENDNEDDGDIIKILIHSNEYNKETSQNKKIIIIIQKLNDNLDEIIDKSKSFEDKIKSIKKIKNLNDYYYYNANDFGEKELKFKIFKLKLAQLFKLN